MRESYNVKNPDRQLYIFKKTLEEDLSVRKVEELVRETSPRKPEKTETTKDLPSSSGQSREVTQLQAQLSSHFGTRVVVKNDGGKGEIKIPFLSVEDLNRIIDILRLS